MSPCRQLGRALAVCSALAIFTCGLGEASGQPFTVQGPGVNSNDFRVTVFASGLDCPLGMAKLSDGSLVVTVNQGGNFFSGSGKLIRLTDTNQNGVADGPATALYTNLP